MDIAAQARDITSAVCQSCGACCSVYIDGELVSCPHLIVSDDQYRCGQYQNRPQVCRDYLCLRPDRPIPVLMGQRIQAALDRTYGLDGPVQL